MTVWQTIEYIYIYFQEEEKKQTRMTKRFIDTVEIDLFIDILVDIEYIERDDREVDWQYLQLFHAIVANILE